MTNTDELADLDKQIELKKQELAVLKVQEDAKTERFGIGLLLLGALACAVGAAASQTTQPKKRRLF